MASSAAERERLAEVRFIRLTLAYDSSRIAEDDYFVGHISEYDRPGRNNGIAADGDLLDDAGTETDGAAMADTGAAGEPHASIETRVRSKAAVVTDRGSGIHDAAAFDNYIGLDNGAFENNTASAKHHVARNNCLRVYDCGVFGFGHREF